MEKVKIYGEAAKNMPWQEKPEGFDGVVWRHDNNPIIDWNPTKKSARIFNSAVLPYEDGFIGVFINSPIRCRWANLYPLSRLL